MKKKFLLLIVTVASILAMVISSGAIAVFADNADQPADLVDTGAVGDGVTVEQSDAAPLYTGLDEFKKIAGNKTTELYMLHRKNEVIVFAVKDVASGSVTYSVPANSTSIKNDDQTKYELWSAAILNYQDKSKVVQKASTGSAVAAGKYTVKNIKDGVQITFKFPDIKNGQGFTVPMTFVLKDDHFDVSVQMNDIVVDEKSTSELLSIAVMPYYGSAKYGEEGYVLIPDGSGALMENSFRALDGGVKYYSSYIYGRDSALDTTLKLGHSEPTVLPLVGGKAGDRAWLGVIETGEAVAMVKAVSAREKFPFTTAYCEFIYNKTDVFATKTNWNIQEYQQVTLEHTDIDNATIRFYAMQGEDSDYVGMAKTYRKYLTEKGAGSDIAKDLPFYIETVGAFQKTESVFGFVTDVTKASTTFEQAQQMVEYFAKKDVKNISLRYTGWMKGGVDNGFVSKAKVESLLGSTDELLALNKYLENQGGRTFLELEIVKMYRKGSVNKISIRNILNNHAVQSIYRRSTGMPSDYKYYLCRPALFEEQVNNFFDSFDKLKEIKGISAGSLGENNYSDFNNSHKSFMDAQQGSDYMSAALANIEKQIGEKGKVMVDTGNAFSYENADVIVGLPMYSNGYEFTFTDVPFAHIALHGLVEYTESAHNLTFDANLQKLRQLETGASPYYVLTDSESSIFLNTRLSDIYTSQYKTWADVAAKDYKELSSVLNGYCDKQITDHDIITNDVRATVYGGERVVLVNYGKTDYALGDATVTAGGYLVMTADEYSAKTNVSTQEGGVEQ